MTNDNDDIEGMYDDAKKILNGTVDTPSRDGDHGEV